MGSKDCPLDTSQRRDSVPLRGCQEPNGLRRGGEAWSAIAPCNTCFRQTASAPGCTPPETGGFTASGEPGRVSPGSAGRQPRISCVLQCAPENTLPTPMVLQR